MKLLTKITDSIYVCDKRATRGNVGVISADTGIYVIDTGMYPVTAKQLLSETKSIDKGNFMGTFTTHHHLDHTGGNQVFNHKPIYAHYLAEKNFASYNQETIEKNTIKNDTKEFFEGFKLTGANSVYSENEFSPPENSDIVCYLVGGHTNGSVIIHYKPENIVFAGDNLFAGFFPWGGDKTASPYAWLIAIDKIINLEPDIISPGHGSVQHDMNELNYFKDFLTKIIRKTEESIKDNTEFDVIFENMMKIPFHDPYLPIMKENSIKHWIRVIEKTLG